MHPGRALRVRANFPGFFSALRSDFYRIVSCGLEFLACLCALVLTVSTIAFNLRVILTIEVLVETLSAYAFAVHENKFDVSSSPT